MITSRLFCRLLTFVFIVCVLATSVFAKDYHVFYLGGQSNMDGYGYNDKLPNHLTGEMPGVMIYHGNPVPDDDLSGGLGRWATLQPGHGAGFSSDGKTNKLSNRFGLELTLAENLRKLFPDINIAFIKYARGGSSIDIAAADQFGCWDPDYQGKSDNNQYDNFLRTVRGAVSVNDIDDDGESDRLIPGGVFWMQGESDAAWGADVAFRYQHNLKRLMDLIRAAFHQDDLPVIIGRISDSGQDDDGRVWNHGEVVRAAQAAFADKDPAAMLVTTTDNYQYSDKWHYDGAGYLDLGRAFAEAFHQLTTRETAGQE